MTCVAWGPLVMCNIRGQPCVNLPSCKMKMRPQIICHILPHVFCCQGPFKALNLMVAHDMWQRSAKVTDI